MRPMPNPENDVMSRFRFFYTVLLPLAWVTISAIGFGYPGDEYGLWALSSIAGSWILAAAPSLHQGQSPREIVPWVLAAGFLTMLPVGYLLDRLRAPRVLFLVVWVSLATLAIVGSISQFPSYERAIAKNGSLTAYSLAGANITLTLTVSIFALVAMGRRLSRSAAFVRSQGPLGSPQ